MFIKKIITLLLTFAIFAECLVFPTLASETTSDTNNIAVLSAENTSESPAETDELFSAYQNETESETLEALTEAETESETMAETESDTITGTLAETEISTESIVETESTISTETETETETVPPEAEVPVAIETIEETEKTTETEVPAVPAETETEAPVLLSASSTPAKASNLKATAYDTYIKLTWTKGNNATGYRIQRYNCKTKEKK